MSDTRMVREILTEMLELAGRLRTGVQRQPVKAGELLCNLVHEALTAAPADPLQSRVHPWLIECFGETIAGDTEERNHRFLEESLELVQSCGCSQSEAHQLVDYVFTRHVGDKSQEVGGVMVTLAALCLAQGLDMHDCGETELARVWTKVEQIRVKQAAKPKHSPLPISTADPWHYRGDGWTGETLPEDAAMVNFVFGGCVQIGNYHEGHRKFLGDEYGFPVDAVEAYMVIPECADPPTTGEKGGEG